MYATDAGIFYKTSNGVCFGNGLDPKDSVKPESA
jgi:hypothetical protein